MERQFFLITAICARIEADCRSRLTLQLGILQLLAADRLEYGCYGQEKEARLLFWVLIRRQEKDRTMKLVNEIRPTVDSVSHPHVQTITQSFILPKINDRHSRGTHFAADFA